MRSSALLLIAALAGSGFCQSYTTFKGFLNTLPSCSRSCGATAFKSIADGCGGEGAKIECICNGNSGDVTFTEAEADGRKGGECAAQDCDSSDVLTFINDLLLFASFCLEKFNSTTPSPSSPASNSGSSSGSSSSPSSGSNSSPSSGSNKLIAPALALGLVGFGLALAI